MVEGVYCPHHSLDVQKICINDILMPMALVQQHGKPDLLIIIMSNPKWEEIKYELRPSEVPQNRPDLTSRVFPAKL